MENKYLNQLKKKPDYVVEYQENGTLNGSTTNANIYGTRLFGPENISTFYMYAASKSHPEDPSYYTIDVDVDNHKHNFNKFIDTNIKVYKFDVYHQLNFNYLGKHDLFLYRNKKDAIQAGKEMAAIDKVTTNSENKNDFKEAYNTVKGIFSNLFDGTPYEKYYKEAVKQVDDVVKKYTSEDTINKVKEQAKECADNVTDTVKDCVKKAKQAYNESWGLSKLIDELNKHEIKNNKGCNTYNYKFFTTSLTLDNGYVIKLKHCNNLYTVVITKGDYRKAYNITEEEYNDIYALMIENVDDDRLTFNSIMDVLKPYVDSRDGEDQKNKKSEKKYPIQFCQFRPEDEVPSQPKPGKAKFKIGDLVYIKSIGINGTVEEVHGTRTFDGKTRKLYTVMYGGGKHNSFWSYQLEKV